MAAPTKIGILDDPKMRRKFLRCIRKGEPRNKACEIVGFDDVKLSRLMSAAKYLEDDDNSESPPAWMRKSWAEEPRRSQLISFRREVKRMEGEWHQEIWDRIKEKALVRDEASISELLKILARAEGRQHANPVVDIGSARAPKGEQQQQGQVMNGGFDWSDPRWMLEYAKCWEEALPQLEEIVQNIDEDRAAGKEDKEGQVEGR